MTGCPRLSTRRFLDACRGSGLCSILRSLWFVPRSVPRRPTTRLRDSHPAVLLHLPATGVHEGPRVRRLLGRHQWRSGNGGGWCQVPDLETPSSAGDITIETPVHTVAAGRDGVMTTRCTEKIDHEVETQATAGHSAQVA